MVTNLVQGQRDLKKLITRKKNTISILNMGRNHKGPTRVVSRFEISDKSGEIEGSVKNSEGSHRGAENKDEDCVSEKYPPDDDKYKPGHTTQHVNTSSPKYNPNARCAYHSNSPGHDTNKCW